MSCPECGSKNIHETQLHECLSGTPMKCTDCYHTWCEGAMVVEFELASPFSTLKIKKVRCPKCGYEFEV